MSTSYDQFYQRKREYLSEAMEEGEVSERERDAIHELCDAFDDSKPTTTTPDWPDAPSHLTNSRKQSTLANWTYFLTEYARRVDLFDTTTEELNQIAEDWLNGDDPEKEDGLARGSIRAYQNAARIFYRYHGDEVEDVEHGRIHVFDREETGIDPNDMLTPEEIDAVRDAPDTRGTPLSWTCSCSQGCETRRFGRSESKTWTKVDSGSTPTPRG